MEAIPTPHIIEIAAKTAGLTMTQVCERAGIAFSTWARWKSGDSSISATRLDAIIKALNDDHKAP